MNPGAQDHQSHNQPRQPQQQKTALDQVTLRPAATPREADADQLPPSSVGHAGGAGFPHAELGELTSQLSEESAALREFNRLLLKLAGPDATQEELATIVGKSRSNVSRLLAGKVPVSPALLNQLRIQAGETSPQVPSFERTLTQILDSFPDDARQPAADAILAFARNLRRKF